MCVSSLKSKTIKIQRGVSKDLEKSELKILEGFTKKRALVHYRSLFLGAFMDVGKTSRLQIVWILSLLEHRLLLVKVTKKIKYRPTNEEEIE